jgi:hypothetical protein
MNKKVCFTISLLVRRCIWLAFLIAVGLVSAPLAQPPLGVLDFRLDLGSLQPQAATVPHGKYLIRIHNGLLAADLTVSVDDDHGKNLAKQGMSKRSSRSRMQLELPPGTYTVQVKESPKWVAKLTVTP